MIKILRDIIGKKVERLFLVVWPPYGETDKTQVDISAGYVFEDKPRTLCVISTEKDDLTTPCIHFHKIPKMKFDWSDFEPRINKWMTCDEGMDLETEYYEVTNAIQFRNIVRNKILDVELVGIPNEDSPLGIKLKFKNDYILSTPIIDGNTIETMNFNQHHNIDNLKHLGNIRYCSVK